MRITEFKLTNDNPIECNIVFKRCNCVVSVTNVQNKIDPFITICILYKKESNVAGLYSLNYYRVKDNIYDYVKDLIGKVVAIKNKDNFIYCFNSYINFNELIKPTCNYC